MFFFLVETRAYSLTKRFYSSKISKVYNFLEVLVVEMKALFLCS